VQHGEHDVDAGEHLARPVGVEDDEPAAGRVAGQRERGAARIDRWEGAVRDHQLPRVGGTQHPGAFRGDADRDDLEALGVEVAHHGAGGDAGDRVFAAPATEHHGHSHLVPAHGDGE
jgi:hypothetical protein